MELPYERVGPLVESAGSKGPRGTDGGTAELISWLSLGIGFVGSWATFATHSALRRLGSLAMSVGLNVFCLAGLYAVLHAPLADHPFFLVLAAFPVFAAFRVRGSHVETQVPLFDFVYWQQPLTEVGQPHATRRGSLLVRAGGPWPRRGWRRVGRGGRPWPTGRRGQ
jgi:hypothetical protein